ncbi:MAG TPA: response regulator [Draconibacterium sp.]|nr:response regulator [Draconibacterium sp.]
MQKTKNPLIFIIEESIIYKDLIVGHLKSHKYANLKIFKSGEECMRELNLNPEIIILDYSSEGMSGLELMKKVKETQPSINFIFLSGQNDVEVAITIMKLGAADYVVKNEKAPARLVRAIDQVILNTKKEKLNKGFTIGVFGFFVLLLFLIAGIIFITLFFNL